MATWKRLLEKKPFAAPWFGAVALYHDNRCYRLEGRLPPEYGWYLFRVDSGRKCSVVSPTEPDYEWLDRQPRTAGYLVGMDRFVPDNFASSTRTFFDLARVFLVPPGLERFTRIRVVISSGRLLYAEESFPLGPENEVNTAFLTGTDIADIRGVIPALEMAFRIEVHQREQAAARRREIEENERKRRAALEAERLIGSAEGRRVVARTNIEAALRSALRSSEADLLDYRASFRPGEYVVDFRFSRQRFQCVVNSNLNVIDAGICLTKHDGFKGDTLLSLESLPLVIREAIRDDKLVRFRHAGN